MLERFILKWKKRRIGKLLFVRFDWLSLILLLIISSIGVLNIYSATRPTIEAVHPNFYIKQVAWIGIGLSMLIVSVFIDYSILKILAYPLYAAGLLALAVVLIAGKGKMGATRWLDLGFIIFQPTEFFRLVFIVALSRYYSNLSEIINKKTFMVAALIFSIPPFLLIMKQPDLGTALIIGMLFILLTMSRGVEKRFFIVLVVVCMIVTPIVGKKVFDKLKDYQKNRIVAFMNPNIDPRGIGYQIEQSKITIGSGMVIGKGFLNGTQGPLRFLPEKHTDFIFSVFAEEWGFIGSTVVLGLYLLLFLRGLDTSVKARDDFGRLVAFGITGMLFVYFMINVGMVLGVMPVVGVPMPFLSYGGTSLIANFLAVGILINIRFRRYGLFH